MDEEDLKEENREVNGEGRKVVWKVCSWFGRVDGGVDGYVFGEKQ